MLILGASLFYRTVESGHIAGLHNPESAGSSPAGAGKWQSNLSTMNTEQENETPAMQVVHKQPASGDLQMMPLEQARHWYNDFVTFSKSIMKVDLDFGIIPGTPKPSLYKPGAEKLRLVYGLTTEQECIDKIVDLDRPYLQYTYRCTVKSKTGQVLAQCEGSCNSMEVKFGYLWKSIHELPEGTDISKCLSKTSGKKLQEFDFAIGKGETSGAYGKSQEYWDRWRNAIDTGIARRITRKSKNGKDLDAWELDETVTVYRVPNPDVIGNMNTIMKMAQKRAFVGAILMATGASEFYTQDIEDMEINGQIHSNQKPVEVEGEVISSETVPPPATKPPVREQQPSQPADNSGFTIPGHWYAKLEKCKKQADLLALYNQHKLTVDANPELKKLFSVRQMELKQGASHV